MSDTKAPSTPEFIRDRLAEHLDGLGFETISEQVEHIDTEETLFTVRASKGTQDVNVHPQFRDGVLVLVDFDEDEAITVRGLNVPGIAREARRRERLLKLVADHPGWDEGSAEVYALGEEITERYAVITTGDTSTVNTAATLEDAQHEALRYVDDSHGTECPSLIIDLDTGGSWAPDWSSLRWTWMEA